MPVVYLNFLEELTDLLQKIFNSYLKPALEGAFLLISTYVQDLLQAIMAGFYYEIWKGLLTILDQLIYAFDIFAGVRSVTLGGVKTDMLTALMTLPSIHRALMIITGIAGCIAFFATVIAVTKSISDMALENKNPLSKVLSDSFKSVLAFLLVPLFCIAALHVSGGFIGQIERAFSGTESSRDTSIGDVIFVAVASDAVITTDQGEKEKILKDYLVGSKPGNDRNYANYDQVIKDFSLIKIRFRTAIIVSAAMMIMMLLVFMTFVKRIIELLLLYLVSPFFVAQMPNDGGQSFNKWKGMFIAKFMYGFGGLLAMRLYLMILPYLFDGTFLFSTNEYVNTIMKLILMVAGGYATYKIQSLIMSIINPQLAAMESTGVGFIMGLGGMFK